VDSHGFHTIDSGLTQLMGGYAREHGPPSGNDAGGDVDLDMGYL
jgi:hypothetical protein